VEFSTDIILHGYNNEQVEFSTDIRIEEKGLACAACVLTDTGAEKKRMEPVDFVAVVSYVIPVGKSLWCSVVLVMDTVGDAALVMNGI
jgi:hypothetical protein